MNYNNKLFRQTHPCFHWKAGDPIPENTIFNGDAHATLAKLPSGSVQAVIPVKDTSRELAERFDLTDSGLMGLQMRVNKLLDDFVGHEVTLVSQSARGFIRNVEISGDDDNTHRQHGR